VKCGVVLEASPGSYVTAFAWNCHSVILIPAGKEFGAEKTVGCIASIGTGKPKVAGFKSPGLFQRLLPSELIKVLANIATDTEAEALAMKARF